MPPKKRARAMACTFSKAEQNKSIDPFTQGLPQEMILRLLSGTWTAADYRTYLQTDYWQTKKAEVFETESNVILR